MTSGLKTIVYPVKDLAAAKSLFAELLGVEPYVDQPYYVGFSAAAQAPNADRRVSVVYDSPGTNPAPNGGSA